jgi:hypothetical protein
VCLKGLINASRIKRSILKKQGRGETFRIYKYKCQILLQGYDDSRFHANSVNGTGVGEGTELAATYTREFETLFLKLFTYRTFIQLAAYLTTLCALHE